MSQSENILEYIDGTLDADAEQQLFDEMAHHPELRVELRHYFNIGDAVRSDREAFAPPAHIERSLMAGLGLAPVVGEAGESLGGGLARLWFGKLGSMLTGFVIGVLLAGTGMYFAVRSGSATEVVSDSVGTVADRPDRVEMKGDRSAMGDAASATESGVSIPSEKLIADGQRGSSVAAADAAISSGISDGAVMSRGHKGNRSERSVVSNMASASTLSPDGDFSASESTLDASGMGGRSQSDTKLIGSREMGLDSARLKTVLPTMLRPSPTETEPPNPASESVGSVASPDGLDAFSSWTSREEDDADTERSWLVEGRYMLGRATFQNNARAVPSAFPENYAVGGYAQVSDALYVGLEGGVERYAQTLYINSHDTLTIDQQPRYSWIGGSLRYQLGTVPAIGVRPFVQATVAGIANVGPLVRLRIGLSREVVAGLSITGGFEASSLVYTFNDQRLFSARWGLTGSMQYDLARLW